MITLTIDGNQVNVSEGMTVLEAAKEAGIYIPTLCYHPYLPPYGACRLCIVEVDEKQGFRTSCTLPASDGMVVRTNTPQLQDFRWGILELILSEHPNVCLTCDRLKRCQPFDICLRSVAVTERCVTCPKNGQCELQKIADYIGIEGMTLPYTYKELPVDRTEPLIERDYNQCILCGRCVQICQEVRGIGAINFIQRGSQTVVGTAFGRPLKDSGCKFCGACVEVCPTGALMDKAAIWQPGLDREAVVAPCRYACPAGIDVPRYVSLCGEGRFDEALAVVREKVTFPATLGRVCIHPCETACRRGQVNEPICIKSLKRAAADLGGEGWKQRAKSVPSTGKKVAIVGAGPAGLTAGYYLAKLGHSVTVFEQFPVAGGMMRVGIPDYRLPVDVLEAEIDVIKSAGVEIKANSKVESIDSLFEQGYDAVFLALGAHRGTSLRVKGEDLPGVVDGATFLREVNLGKKVALGDKVAVIGGGNVAMDSARTALRLGTKKVTIVYRRTRAEMPASPEEIEEALHEDIEIIFLAAPQEIKQKKNKLVMTYIRMELGEPDASGRRRPVPIKGSEFTMEFDSIIGAIGQVPDIPGEFSLKLTRWNTIEADSETLVTNRQGVFAGGDVVSGPASVIEAIAAGRKAASSIDMYLGGSGDIAEELVEKREYTACVGKDTDFAHRASAQMPCLAMKKRVTNFDEAELGFSEQTAVEEASRCCQCAFRLQIPPVPLPPVPAKTPEPVLSKS